MMSRLISFSTLLLIAMMSSTSIALPAQPTNPIMGIITDPLQECGYTPPTGTVQCVESFYVRWLATAGIRSVPIPWNTTKEHRDSLLQQVNGVLFPGGALVGTVFDEYFAVVEDVVKTAIRWNQQGDPFLVWGTCMGFQVVCAAVGGSRNLIKAGFTGTDPSMLPLIFTQNQADSRMYGNATCPADILSTLQYQNSTLNWHQAGVPPEEFTSNANMSKYLKVLSTNLDTSGRSFVSSVEGADGIQIYATQYHPERPPYEYTSDVIGHTVDDIKVSQYLARFIKVRMQMNNHTFSSPQVAEQHSIHNYEIVNYGLGYELYWLPHLEPMPISRFNGDL